MWFKVSSMNSSGNEEFLTNSQFSLSNSAADRLGIRRFPARTIVFPKRGGAIATNKKRKLGVDAALDLNVMAVTATNILPEYLWFWFQGLDLSTISNGSNVPQINHGDVEPLVIPVPSEEEQTEIVRQLCEALNHASLVETKVQRCLKFFERFDQAALAKAFRGELIPNKVVGEAQSQPSSQTEHRAVSNASLWA
jgi:type I restriction enzyme S subunit